MTVFYAQPYDISATGFYFETMENYHVRAAKCLNDFGDQVEEFELQFIDGNVIDIDLCKALGLYQNNISKVIEFIEGWDDSQKLNVIIAVGEWGYNFDFETGDPDDYDIDLYEVDSMRELAEQFVDEGLYGKIPQSLQFYIDYAAIARDLVMDYSEIKINGTTYIYRCS